MVSELVLPQGHVVVKRNEVVSMDKKITRSPSRRYVKQIALTSILIAFIAVGYSFNQANSAGRSQSVNLSSLDINAVEQGEFIDALSLRAQVIPKTTIYLDTITGGQVIERLVEQGEYVQQGQALVRLSNTNLQLDVMGREAQVTEQLNFLRNTQMTMETSRLNLRRDLLDIERQINHLKRRLKQSDSLVQKGALAQEQLDEITEDLKYFVERKKLTIERQKQENSIRKVQVAQLEDSATMLQSNLQFARKNLENLLIKAPVSGYLSDLNVEIGESKDRGTRLGQIDMPDEYKLVARLDEFYLNQIHLGMPVFVKLDNDVLSAEVSKIDSRVNQSQFQIEVDLPANRQSIKRGQSIDIDIMLGGNQSGVLMLKRGAFFNSSGGNWVFVVQADGKVAKRRTIKLGKKNQDYYEIVSGLSAGERVITSSYGNYDQAQQLNLE